MHAPSHRVADAVKGGKLSYMALALQREPTAYRLLLMRPRAVLADPKPMLTRLVRGCIALAPPSRSLTTSSTASAMTCLRSASRSSTEVLIANLFSEGESAASSTAGTALSGLEAPPRPPASAASVKQRAGVYNYVKGDGSCPYCAVLACLRRLEHASIEGEKIPTAKDLHSVDSVLRHSVE